MIDRGSWKVVDFEKTYVYMFVKRIWNTKQKVRMFLGYMLILAAYMIYECAVICPSIDRFAKVEQNSGRSDGQGPCVKNKV